MLHAILGTSPLSENQKRINQTTHPLTTLTQLFFLVVKEEGTKVEFKDHCIHFMRPIMGQAVARIRDGTSFVDLDKLRTSFDEVVKMYPPKNIQKFVRSLIWRSSALLPTAMALTVAILLRKQ